ncbi:MAG: hypothetical protein ACRDVL_06025 [Acidimicrobiia bacterium]
MAVACAAPSTPVALTTSPSPPSSSTTTPPTATPTTTIPAPTITIEGAPGAPYYDANGRAPLVWVSAQGRGYVADLVEDRVTEVPLGFDPSYGLVLADGSLITSDFHRATPLLIRRSGQEGWETILAEEGMEFWLAGYAGGGDDVDLLVVGSDAETPGFDYGETLSRGVLSNSVELTETWRVEGTAHRVSPSSDERLLLVEIMGVDPVYGPSYEIRDGSSGELVDLPGLPRTEVPEGGEPAHVIWGLSLLEARQVFYLQTRFGTSMTEAFIKDLDTGSTVPAWTSFPGLPKPEAPEPAFFGHPLLACRFADRILDVRGGALAIVDLLSGARIELLDTGQELRPSC